MSDDVPTRDELLTTLAIQRHAVARLVREMREACEHPDDFGAESNVAAIYRWKVGVWHDTLAALVEASTTQGAG